MGASFTRPVAALILGFVALALFSGSSRDVQSTGGTVIAVSTTDDELNSDGDCSLREAIDAANKNLAVDSCPAGGSDDVIQLAAGTYQIARMSANEDMNLTGDFDILGNLTIDGDLDAVDQLKILQFVAAIPFTQNDPSVDVGDSF